MPGEAPLNVLLAMNGVREVDGVEVIDSLGARVRAAEEAVLQRRAGGLPDAAGYFGATVDPVRRDEILTFYGLDPE